MWEEASISENNVSSRLSNLEGREGYSWTETHKKGRLKFIDENKHAWPANVRNHQTINNADD